MPFTNIHATMAGTVGRRVYFSERVNPTIVPTAARSALKVRCIFNPFVFMKFKIAVGRNSIAMVNKNPTNCTVKLSITRVSAFIAKFAREACPKRMASPNTAASNDWLVMGFKKPTKTNREKPERTEVVIESRTVRVARSPK